MACVMTLLVVSLPNKCCMKSHWYRSQVDTTRLFGLYARFMLQWPEMDEMNARVFFPYATLIYLYNFTDLVIILKNAKVDKLNFFYLEYGCVFWGVGGAVIFGQLDFPTDVQTQRKCTIEMPPKVLKVFLTFTCRYDEVTEKRSTSNRTFRKKFKEQEISKWSGVNTLRGCYYSPSTCYV